MSTETSPMAQQPKRRLVPLDYLAIIAGVINAVVIGFIVVSWLMNQ